MAADINAAPIITEQADAVARMNSRLDEVIPKRYRKAGVEHPAIVQWVAEYAQEPAEARSLLIMGPTGTGKTHAAYGALRGAACAALRPNRAGRYVLGTWMATTFPDFLAAMRPGQFERGDTLTSQKYMLALRETPLLVIDDLGMAKANEFVEECTHRLISGRYDDERPTIYTTNLSPARLADGVGGRIASRLMQECVKVPMTGADRRLSQ